MSGPSRAEIVTALLDRHGRTYAGELGIPLRENTPSPLFRWLCAALLLSARIGAGQAMSAARALAEAGWTTPEKMAEATWRERTDVLNRASYARYDESTSRMLEDAARHLVERWGGDLRKLRAQADGDPDALRTLLKEFKGIGDVGADIFLREGQAAWEEFYPFADDKALNAARALGLGDSAEALARLVSRDAFPCLVAALVRADLADDAAAVRDAAAGSSAGGA